MSSDSENLIALNFDICYSKNKNKKNSKKTETHLNESMAGKTGMTEVHALTYFQNFC